ncbi:endo-1,4-beta-xylanase [Sphaerisporangium sp. B11E5]|uniref:endo-1,4-beta-xylanase n=1 Tax=Sphaerisporangium sp. B11E5 TaxID=3153563 RepID=UPI00325ECD83
MKVTRLAAVFVSVSALLVSGASQATATTPRSGEPSDETISAQWHGWAKAPLRRVAPKGFRVGAAAAGGGHHLEQDYPDPFTFDRVYRRALDTHFSSLTPENQLKWEFVHPERDRYEFGAADAIVRFAREHGQAVRGHTLLWHSQNPAWLNEGNFGADELRAILRDHIRTVVGRYKGKIHQWDVANEIFDGNGNLRTAENIWLRVLGPGVIADAFRWAHQADPKAKLFLNDFGAENINARSDAYLKLAQELRAAGVPVHGFAVQAHLSLPSPFPATMAANLKRFEDAGFETAVTELDVRMPLPGGAGPTPEQLATQADYFRQALEACLSVERCNSFTVWGTIEKYSWVPIFFPEQGQATILWDDYRPKPAYHALQSTLAAARRR